MATITLENIPDEVHAALKARAEQTGRTMPEEAVDCLKSALASPPEKNELSAVRSLRQRLEYVPPLTNEFLQEAIEEGRP